MDNNQMLSSFDINELFGRKISIVSSESDGTKRHVKLKNIGDIKHLNKDIVSTIARNIGLLFLEKREDGNVCFANNNEEIRDEFKQVFEPADILNYLLGVLNSPGFEISSSQTMIPVPENADVFWQNVNIGKITGL